MTLTQSRPILYDFPESIESDRLIIRAPLYGDGVKFYEAVQESMKELDPWLPWAKHVNSLEEAEANIRFARLKFLEREDLRFHLLCKKTGTFIGACGIQNIDWEARRFEIGYWLRTVYSGQGYMTEAVRALEYFAIQELEANRLEIFCDARNTRSIQIPIRLGYTQEGVQRCNQLHHFDGTLRDTIMFAKVKGIEY